MTNAKAILLLSSPDPKGFVVTSFDFIFPFHIKNRIPVRGIKKVLFS